jgi:cbb3-type cytochrome oxidase subunit 1
MMPARWVPLLYFAFAQACLATAFAALAFQPGSLAGFFYHPKMLAVVHLVTLGWISASILGAVYVIGPVALRMPLPARRAYVAFAAFAVGLVYAHAHLAALGWGAMMVVGAGYRMLPMILPAAMPRGGPADCGTGARVRQADHG